MSKDFNQETIRFFSWAKLWIEAFPTLIHEILDDESIHSGPTTADCKESEIFLNNPSLRIYLGVLAFQSLVGKYTPSNLYTIHNENADNLLCSPAIQQLDSLTSNRNLIYGEIDPESIAWCISYICWYHMSSHGCPFMGEKIVDLGSGCGKALLVASFMYPFRQAMGIEIVPSLHQAALELFLNTIGNEYVFLDQRIGTTKFSFLNEDLNYVDSTVLYDADVILVHATMFDHHLMEQVHNLCKLCNDGTYVIMVSQSLWSNTNTPNQFQTIVQVELSMTWGKTNVFIQRKIGQESLMNTNTVINKE